MKKSVRDNMLATAIGLSLFGGAAWYFDKDTVQPEQTVEEVGCFSTLDQVEATSKDLESLSDKAIETLDIAVWSLVGREYSKSKAYEEKFWKIREQFRTELEEFDRMSSKSCMTNVSYANLYISRFYGYLNDQIILQNIRLDYLGNNRPKKI